MAFGFGDQYIASRIKSIVLVRASLRVASVLDVYNDYNLKAENDSRS